MIIISGPAGEYRHMDELGERTQKRIRAGMSRSDDLRRNSIFQSPPCAGHSRALGIVDLEKKPDGSWGAP